jgi:5-formyltetrahydrofolate cyclo-ligase
MILSGQPDKSGPVDKLSSPPCYADELATDFNPQTVGPENARKVAQWRKAERSRLRSLRQQLSGSERMAKSEALAGHLRALLDSRYGNVPGLILSSYWPIKGELNLRPLMVELHDKKFSIALPIVETKAAPLNFRRWTPETRLVRGDWNIPVPPPDAPALKPDITLVPLVGWDDAGYRLGYGGGYFDRTLAALSRRPFTIGVGLQSAKLTTIYPQPHDIPLDIIMTEAGIQVEMDKLR